MPFDDLTPNQIQTLIQLIETLNSGNYQDEFIWTRQAGQHQGSIHLYGKSGVSDHDIPGFTNTDIETLKQEGYLIPSGKMTALKSKAFQQYKLLKDPLNLFPTLEQRLQKTMPSLDIFISHSNKDKEVAEALINLLRSALNIPADRIRCTSVDGYRLPAGASTDDQLRQEIYKAKAFIGLITPTSFQSAYVLFELGARWGARFHLAPVLASGADVSILRGPLTGFNALSCDVPAQVYQLVDNLSSTLNVILSSPSVYQKYVDALVQASQKGKKEFQNQIKSHAAEASIFSSAEEKEFQHIHKMLDRRIDFSFTSHLKTTDQQSSTKGEREAYSVNLIYAITSYIERGGNYFEISRLELNLLNELYKRLLIDKDEKSIFLERGDGINKSLTIDLKKYGLIRHTLRTEFHELKDGNEITEKMYRFIYWLTFNNYPVDSSLEYVEIQS